MNIGQAAKQTGISAKMIRHYEALGVIPRAPKSSSGYRRYEAADVMRLDFIRRARDAGLSISEIRKLLSLWQNERRSARDVKALVRKHLDEVESRLDGLLAVKQALSHLMSHCAGDERPECPILDAFSHGAMTSAGAVPRTAPSRSRKHKASHS